MSPTSNAATGPLGLNDSNAPFFAQPSSLEWELLNTRCLSENAEADAALFRAGMQAGREWGSEVPIRDQKDQGEQHDCGGERLG